MMRVLGVHGVNNHRSVPDAARRLADRWAAALATGLGSADDFSLDVAYYAHRLHLGTAQGPDDPHLLPVEAQELIVEWARALGAPDAVPQGHPRLPVRDLIWWIADRYGLDRPSVQRLATWFFREVHTYFTEPDRREAARSDVADALARTHPTVLIAHSLGSVVSYEALWTHEHPPIDLFLTLGSPLAMPHVIYDRLAAHEGPRARPPGVREWINIADPWDCIAIPPGGLPAGFQHVDADLTTSIGTFAVHKVTKYLISPETLRILQPRLTGPG
jgi:hypothetical protein